MAIAAGAKVALRITSAISGATDDSGKKLFTIITAAIGSVILLIAAVLSILSSPIQFIGSLGDFQSTYSHVITDNDSAAQGGSSANHALTPVVIDDTEIQSVYSSITDPQRKAVIDAGLSLLGKVSYFWGGKSAAGWNDAWGDSRLVTSAGSYTTGTYKPYGLDCSGFVDWCYKTAGIGDMLSAGGTGWQWGQSYAITADQLKPGDLVFKNPGSWSENHVGLYLGTDSNGNMLFMHCAGSSGVVINSYSGFKYFRRVAALDG